MISIEYELNLNEDNLHPFKQDHSNFIEFDTLYSRINVSSLFKISKIKNSVIQFNLICFFVVVAGVVVAVVVAGVVAVVAAGGVVAVVVCCCCCG